ncbi:HisA/HisF-related TIM barrel protein [Alphaproteobacteria bacterium]|nr:HisA/HisF-related TIM barrel protein [Alphaproteobacteria bacterium]
MLKKRLIPILQINKKKLVKSIQYKKINYIGDPINTMRIFNSLEVDEMIILDLYATKNNVKPDFDFLQKISKESFVPLSYGGNINSLNQAESIFKIGYEKIILNTLIINDIELLVNFINRFGSQAIIVSIDLKKNLFGKYNIYSNSGTIKKNYSIDYLINKLKSIGCGEILINDIDREGTWKGLNIELAKKISNQTSIPIIINGGANNIKNVKTVLNETKVSAIGTGNMVVYQKKDMGVLINYPKVF